MRVPVGVLCFVVIDGVYGQPDIEFHKDWDLHSFVTRPDIRAPKLEVKNYVPEELSSGFLFTDPYADLLTRPPSHLYSPGQTGPHIYDNEGDLVWSGAELFRDRNTFDFKASVNGSGTSLEQTLTFILGGDDHDINQPGGAGIVLDSSYQIRQRVHVKGGTGTINMHEFSTVDNGKNALLITFKNHLFDSRGTQGLKPDFVGWIVDLGFLEIEIATEKVLFQWWASDHVNPVESTVDMPPMPGTGSTGWDYFHINSIDKDDNGDYLISARHTNTIYKISGKDGSIIWRLGGKKSDFTLTDFDFSSQHDARFRKSNETHTIISFLNNASDGHLKTSDFSSALIVALESTTMTATVLKRWDRPDVRTTNLRGNVQLLPNGNTFVGWSANGYMSEFTADGRCIMEGQFTSSRFSTYRSYRYSFTGTPVDPPDVKAFAFGTTPQSMTTVAYVSWNGATQVAWWNFYGSQMQHSGYELLGSSAKTGFETVYQAGGYYDWIVVEAQTSQGRALRNSSAISTQTALGYDGVHVGANAIGKVSVGGSWNPPVPGVSDVLKENWQKWPYRSAVQYAVIGIMSLVALAVLASAGRRLTRSSGYSFPTKTEREQS